MNNRSIKEILEKLKEKDKEEGYLVNSFCLDCADDPSDECSDNEHTILYRTTDECEFCTAITVIEWLIKNNYVKLTSQKEGVK